MNSLISCIAAAAMLISSGAATISLSGAVKNAGDVAIEKPMKLRSFLKTYCQLAPDADLKKVHVTSDGAVRVVDATRLDQNIQLTPGDSVLVPAIDPSLYVFVDGAVANRGAQDYTKGLTVREAVAQASPIKGAQTKRVEVTRTEAGEEKTYQIDLSGKDLQANMILMPGDKVTVPAMQAKSNQELITIVIIGLLLIVLLR